MEPVELIVTALATGAALGLEESASSLVKDAYARLKALVARRLAGRPDGRQVLAGHEVGRQGWAEPLAAELAAAGAASDLALIAAARELVTLAGPGELRPGKYMIDARGSHGVQIGDHDTQHNTFGPQSG
jgi:hypothetical protein